MPPANVLRGEPWPLGATPGPGGTNFALHAPNATQVDLLLFDDLENEQPAAVVALGSRQHRSAGIWHAHVVGAGPGTLYGWRVHGPPDAHPFQRFDGEKLLLDPRARAVRASSRWSRAAAARPGPNVDSALRSMVVEDTPFPATHPAPRIKPTERILYELHVRGFTVHPSSGVREPGKFRGLIEKIPYLVDLGITTVELLPIFEFDPTAPSFIDPDTGEPLTDFWGYNPIGFFAPHHAYSGDDLDEAAHGSAFRDLVRAFHEAGIEVILDVVYNHTGEGGEDGPTLSFSGIDNRTWYIEDPEQPGRYVNHSGCGNTFNCNHPSARRLILDSLRYWVESMGVDGFRFDLASVFTRGQDGRPMVEPPLPWEIETAPSLAGILLIAEAWDAGGLFQVGRFPGERWAEWNGCFRDDVRRFWRGDPGMAGQLATRMMGSPDLFQGRGRTPAQGINFITCHDGFTLNDLVSFRDKHNRRNGEGSRDGTNDNHSWNHGVEGTEAPATVQRAREQDIRNLLATLLLAQGTPMLLAGDEFRRTQNGNNNAWCQDNDVSWIDWGLLEEHAQVHAFTRSLIRFRQIHPSIHRARFLVGEEAPPGEDSEGYPRVAWHGLAPFRPDWDRASRLVLFTLSPAMDDCALCVLLHAGDEDIEVELPPVPGGRVGASWSVAVDTSREGTHAVLLPGREEPLRSRTSRVPARCVMALVSPDDRALTPGMTGRMFAVGGGERR